MPATPLPEFAMTVVAISVSGVMAPGPLFTSNVYYGAGGGWKSGIRMAVGHTLVEGPLVVLIGVGAISLGAFPEFGRWVSALGAVSLFVFAGLQVRSAFGRPNSAMHPRHGPLIAGIVLSALNPFFLAWWLSIGFKLVSDAIALYSLAGIGIVFGFHIWMDYAWLGAVGFVSGRGRSLLSARNWRILMAVLAGVMVYFGATFLSSALR